MKSFPLPARPQASAVPASDIEFSKDTAIEGTKESSCSMSESIGYYRGMITALHLLKKSSLRHR